MRYGVVILPEHHWPRAREVWSHAEALGFDHGWTYDHLSWRWLRDKPWFGAVPTLAAVAVATSRIRIGTLVANPGLRNPAAFAKDLTTIDDISGGRVICGIGAGGYDPEVLTGKNLSPAERMARFTEFVELTDALLRGQPVTHAGTYYRGRDLVMSPGCVQNPRMPIAVAASGPVGMRLAARLADIWVTTGRPGSFEPEPFKCAVPLIKAQVAALDGACAVVGRDPSTIRRLLVTGPSIGGILASTTSFEQAAGAFEDCGVTDLVVHWPRPEFPYAARVEVLEGIADRVLRARPERA